MLESFITYGAPEATSDNFALLPHVELIKSCDAPELNKIITGCSLRKNVPANTFSPMGIFSTVVLKVDNPVGVGPQLLMRDVEQHTGVAPSMLGVTKTTVNLL
jgi:hypothetical protein